MMFMNCSQIRHCRAELSKLVRKDAKRRRHAKHVFLGNVSGLSRCVEKFSMLLKCNEQQPASVVLIRHRPGFCSWLSDKSQGGPTNFDQWTKRRIKCMSQIAAQSCLR